MLNLFGKMMSGLFGIHKTGTRLVHWAKAQVGVRQIRETPDTMWNMYMDFRE